MGYQPKMSLCVPVSVKARLFINSSKSLVAKSFSFFAASNALSNLQALGAFCSVGLFLPSGLGFLHGNDSTWMFWVPYRSTSMLEIVPKDDEEGYDREDSEKD